MGLTNYPKGFSNGITIQNMPILNSYSSNIFWVDSVNGNDQNPGTFEQPLATLDYAVGKCTANKGDIIMVKANHSETISSATALALDVAGISIVGLGKGNNRPTLTLDTATTSTIGISAANIGIKNFKFLANFADIVSLFTLTTAKNFSLEDCESGSSAADMNFTRIINTNTTDNDADGLSLNNCSWIEPDLATETLINVAADLDQLNVSNCYLNLGANTSDLPAIAVVETGKDLTNVLVEGNNVIRLNDANPLLITADTTTANTGMIKNNAVRHLDTAGEELVTAGTNFGFIENFASAAIDASGYLLPAADS